MHSPSKNPGTQANAAASAPSATACDQPLVVFDLDDTLFLEREFAECGFAAVADQFTELLGPPESSWIKMRELYDSTRRRSVFNAILEERGIEPREETIQQMVAAYRRCSPTLTLLADAKRALTRLRPLAKLAVITDGPLDMQQQKAAALRIAEFVDLIVFTSQWGDDFTKPHPKAFETVAESLSVPHHRCTYVADNPTKDFLAPNVLGWKTVRILRSAGVYRDSAACPGGAPGRVIDSLDQL